MGDTTFDHDVSPAGVAAIGKLGADALRAREADPSLDANNAAYYRRPGVCDGTPQTTGCMFSRDERQTLVGVFKDRLAAAESNYKLAIEHMKVHELMRKSEDASWVGLLILDLLTMHLGSTLVEGFTNLRANKLTVLDALPRLSSKQILLQEGLELANPSVAQGAVKLALDKGKKSAGDAMKAAAEGQAENVTFLTTLQDEAGIGFQAIREVLPRILDDTSMLGLVESFDAAIQSTSAYETALRAKLDRFRSSGANDIGRRSAWQETKTDYGTASQPVVRDTRVAWVLRSGGLELRYQYVDGRLERQAVPPEVQGAAYAGEQPSFGHFGEGAHAADTLDGPLELGELVPTEFVGVALAHHKAVWGGDPPTVVMHGQPAWYDVDGDGKWFGGEPAQAPTPSSPQDRVHSQPLFEPRLGVSKV